MLKKLPFFLIALICFPVFSQISNLTSCSSSGSTVFDLSVQTPVLIAMQPTGNYLVSYHLSLADATSGSNSIANPTAYINISSPQTIYARIINATTNSIAINYFNLIVDNPPAVPIQTSVTNCAYFVLPIRANGNYYTGPNGTGMQLSPGTFITTSQTLYVFAQSQSGNCFSESWFTITIIPTPKPTLQNGVICVDSNNNVTSTYTLDTGLTTSQYSFSWELEGATIVGATGSSLTVSSPGKYCVNVMTNDRLSCINTSCSLVAVSSAPVVSAVAVKGRTISVSAYGLGNYEYQLDSGAYQTSPVFDNVAYGSHSVFVKDLNGCGISVSEVLVPITIDAVADTIYIVAGTTSTDSALDNDILNTIIVIPADVNVTLVTPSPTGFSLNPIDGTITVENSTALGNYSLSYQIYENNNPTNYDTAVATIKVVDPTPPPTGLTSQSLPEGSTLANLIVAGQNIEWYSTNTSPAGRTKSENSLPLSTVLLNNSNYYASQTINGIKSKSMLAVKVTLTALSKADYVFSNFSQYPNPVKNSIIISNDSVIDTIVVLDINGKNLMAKTINSTKSEIDLSSLSKGFYFMTVKAEGTEKTVKLIKE